MCAYITRCLGPQMYALLLYFCALVKIKVLCLQWCLGEISTKTSCKGSCGESLPQGGTGRDTVRRLREDLKGPKNIKRPSKGPEKKVKLK